MPKAFPIFQSRNESFDGKVTVTKKLGFLFALIAAASFSFLAIAYFRSDITTTRSRNNARSEDLKLIMSALERYQAKYGSYPIGSGEPLSNLQNELVGGGFLTVIPEDPRPELLRYLYASNGKFYGVLVRFEEALTILGTKPALLCMVGVDNTGTGIFGEPPPCNI